MSFVNPLENLQREVIQDYNAFLKIDSNQMFALKNTAENSKVDEKDLNACTNLKTAVKAC